MTEELLMTRVGWPVTQTAFPNCSTFCFPDRLGNGFPYTSANISSFPTLEELGIEDWRHQVIRELVPQNSLLLVWILAETWKTIKLSDSSLASRLELGRKKNIDGSVFATIPSSLRTTRDVILKFIGYDAEYDPEFIFVSDMDTTDVFEECLLWSKTHELWRNPCYLVLRYAERVLAFHDGWIYLAVPLETTRNVHLKIENLARRWNITMIGGPVEWSWFAKEPLNR